MTHIKQKGFTLIEMIVVLGIFAVVSGVVLFNYSKFRSTTALINMAYEVALSIREAQIYGVSVRSPEGGIATASFSKSYGIFIQGAPTNQYALFADEGSDKLFKGSLPCTIGASECVTPYALQGNIVFGGTCTIDSLGGLIENDEDLHILFKRPNPEPIINNNTSIEKAQITVMSDDNTKRYVVIANNGQISVVNESISPACN